MPAKFVVDTNVPITANLATTVNTSSDVPLECVSQCVKAIDNIVTNGGLVLDSGEEIFTEYRQSLSLKGQPGIGDVFIKWVNDNRWNPTKVDQVSITKIDSTYAEFPQHPDLELFDNSDRKFVAVANAHPQKPPILQATDSKWWGWSPALHQVGITVNLICSSYIESKYEKKIGS